MAYFRNPDLPPELPVYDDTTAEVILMSGLPASGKDTWIARHATENPVISLDSIREELGVRPEDDQGRVIQRGRELAREYLRDQRGYVWNATNTSALLRRQLIDLFVSYRARVSITYVETSLAEQARRNAARDRPVPNAVTEQLRRRLDVPTSIEAHEVVMEVT